MWYNVANLTYSIFLTLYIGYLGFLLSVGVVTDIGPLVKVIKLSILIHLLLYTLKVVLKKAGYALLALTILIVGASYLPRPERFLEYAFFLMLGLGIYLQVRGEYRYKKTSVKQLVIIAAIVMVAGHAAALIIYGSLSRNIGTFFINEEINQLTLNADTLYHASLAEMMRGYGKISTGLNGLQTIKYHVFSHYSYGIIAKISGSEIYEIYGFGTSLLFAPLLHHIILMVFTEQFISKEKSSVLRYAILNGLLIYLFSENFGYFSDSNYVSESYLISLIYLFGFISILHVNANNALHRILKILVVSTYVGIIFPAKVSVGFMALGAYIIFTIYDSPVWYKVKVWKAVEVFLPLIPALVGYRFAKPAAIEGMEVKIYPFFYYLSLHRDEFIVYFHVMHFLMFLLAIYLYVDRTRENALFADYWRLTLKRFLFPLKENIQIQRYILSLLFVALVGFAGLNITVDSSGYYFSNVHAYFSILVMAYYIPDINSGNFSGISKSTRAVLAILVISIIYYFAIIFPGKEKEIQKLKNEVLLNRRENVYIKELRSIRKESSGDNKYMVYIPKSETDFWKNHDDTYSAWKDYKCIQMPFYIPVLTGLPAVYGLPDKSCYIFFRGYQAYPERMYDLSQRLDIPESEICDKVRSLNFEGYFDVRKDGYKKIDCK